MAGKQRGAAAQVIEVELERLRSSEAAAKASELAQRARESDAAATATRLKERAAATASQAVERLGATSAAIGAVASGGVDELGERAVSTVHEATEQVGVKSAQLGAAATASAAELGERAAGSVAQLGRTATVKAAELGGLAAVAGSQARKHAADAADHAAARLATSAVGERLGMQPPRRSRRAPRLLLFAVLLGAAAFAVSKLRGQRAPALDDDPFAAAADRLASAGPAAGRAVAPAQGEPPAAPEAVQPSTTPSPQAAPSTPAEDVEQAASSPPVEDLAQAASSPPAEDVAQAAPTAPAMLDPATLEPETSPPGQLAVEAGGDEPATLEPEPVETSPDRAELPVPPEAGTTRARSTSPEHELEQPDLVLPTAPAASGGALTVADTIPAPTSPGEGLAGTVDVTPNTSGRPLAEEVRGRLDADDRTSGLSGLAINVAEGTVFVRGSVPSGLDPDDIRRIIAGTPGVTDVDLQVSTS